MKKYYKVQLGFSLGQISLADFSKKKKKNLFPNQPMHVDFSPPQVKKQSCFYIWNLLQLLKNLLEYILQK